MDVSSCRPCRKRLQGVRLFVLIKKIRWQYECPEAMVLGLRNDTGAIRAKLGFPEEVGLAAVISSMGTTCSSPSLVTCSHSVAKELTRCGDVFSWAAMISSGHLIRHSQSVVQLFTLLLRRRRRSSRLSPASRPSRLLGDDAHGLRALSFHVLREKFQSVVAPCIHHTSLLPPEKSNRRITAFISFISSQQSTW